MSEKTYIAISGLRLYGYHGVGEPERRVGGWYRYDLCLSYDASAAMSTDDVADAVNYADVAALVAATAAEPCRLLEHLAAKIRREVCCRFAAVTGGKVSVTKLAPPVIHPFEATFTVEW